LQLARVSRLRVSIHIARPRREVYEFLAGGRLRRLWLAERSVLRGKASDIEWKVTAREAPRRVAMHVRAPRGEADVDLRLAPKGKGTLCECEIAYHGVRRLMDVLLVQPRMRREASRALAALKQALESSASTSSRAASG
jgi:hypothetical protein